MSRILVFGAHGKVALLLSPLLVARAHAVTGIIRNPDHHDAVAASGATPVLADLERLDTEALAHLVRGHDAVVWTAGAGGGLPARTYAVDRDAAIRSMDAAVQAGATRYVMVSWIGSNRNHGIAEDDPFFPYADAKLAADEYLRQTNLDFTVLGPGTLTLDEPTGMIQRDAPERGAVARGDVAAVIAATLEEPATIGATIRFGNGTAGTAQPIRTVLADSAAG